VLAALAGVLFGCAGAEDSTEPARSASTDPSRPTSPPASPAPESASTAQPAPRTTANEPPTDIPAPKPPQTGAPTRREQARLDAGLREAAWDNDVDLARRLIQRGANVNAKDITEQSAYLIATSEGYGELLEVTLANGANVHSLDSFNGTGLIRAAERGHADVVDRLLRTDIEVNHVNNLGWTALLEAVILGDGSPSYQAVIRMLLAAGAVPALADRQGTTALQHAETRGYSELAAILRAAD
jgi:hypothetical protein